MNLKNEENLLRQQMKLLAEQYRGREIVGATGVSDAMCRIYQTLVADRLVLFALIGAMSFNLSVYGIVQIIKGFRRKA